MEPIHQTRAVRRAAQNPTGEQENQAAQPVVGQGVAAPVAGRGRGRGAAPRGGRGRGRGRANAATRVPEPVRQPQAQLDLASLVVALQQRLEAQEVVMQELKAELQQRRLG